MPTPTAMLIQGNYRSFRVNMSNKYIGEGDENIYQVHDLVQSFGFTILEYMATATVFLHVL